MAHFGAEAGVALLFAILYFCLAVWMVFCFSTHRFKIRSRWAILAFHTFVRVASQACGVAFGVLAFENTDVFVAYLILGAEGYFTLTLASYHFLKNWQKVNLGFSFLRPSKQTKEESWRMVGKTLSFQPLFMPQRYYKTEFLSIVESVLIPANALIITGGSYLAGSTRSDLTAAQLADRENTAKILRTTGSALFYSMTVAFNCCLVKTFFDERRYQREGKITRKGVHPTLIVLAVVAFWLNLRGLFGVLQSGVTSLSYNSRENYTGDGFTSRFTAIEYCLTVLPEFSAAFLLNMTYFTKRRDVRMEGSDDFSMLEKKPSETATPPSKV